MAFLTGNHRVTRVSPVEEYPAHPLVSKPNALKGGMLHALMHALSFELNSILKLDSCVCIISIILITMS